MMGFQAKGKLEQTHTPSCLACSAETGNPPFDCEMKEQNREQSPVVWCLHLRSLPWSQWRGQSDTLKHAHTHYIDLAG